MTRNPAENTIPNELFTADCVSSLRPRGVLFGIAFGALIPSEASAQQPSSPNQQFIGTWALVSFERQDPDGRMTYPYGKDAVGQLIYDPDGHMSVIIMSAHRANFISSVPRDGLPTEKTTAFDTVLAYAGNYLVDMKTQTMIHIVEFSSYPNYVHSRQNRNYVIAGDQLTLSLLNGGGNGSGPAGSVSRLVWKRDLPAR